ncbi:hypothetical protein ACF0H5_023308 [Mactra antiquata]
MRLFWTPVKRRSVKRSNLINAIEDGDTIARDPSSIAELFRKYYAKVVTPRDNKQFDLAFLYDLDNKMSQIRVNDDYSEDSVLTREVTRD